MDAKNKYILVVDEHMSTLETKVNGAIFEGYAPHGSLAVVEHSYNHHSGQKEYRYIQPMILVHPSEQD
jgi:hypothetical protein